jgi:hypothetical protein
MVAKSFEQINPFSPEYLHCAQCGKETAHKLSFTVKGVEQLESHDDYFFTGKATCYNCGSTQSMFWETK